MSAATPQQSTEAQSVARPNRWPLIVMPQNRGENTSKDARLVNGYMEKELQGDSWLYKRPGLQVFSRPSGGTGLGQGAYNWRGDVYTIFNGHLYKNNVDKGGTINTQHGVYRWSSTMGATPKVIFQNGYHAFCYDDASGLQDFTGDITEAVSPPWVKGWAYLDGTTYLMTPDANIYGSDINVVTGSGTWDPLNKIVAQIEPSAGVGFAKQLVYAVALKEDSTEMFFDAGNATGSPLGPVQGAKVNWGTISADSIRDIDGALFWLSTNRSATVQIMKMDNLKIDIISTPAIERLLESADFTTVFSWTLKLEGHRWYAITLKNNNLTLVYDLTTGLWAQWTDASGNYLPIVDSTYKTDTAQTLLQHETNGYLYTVSATNYTDAGEVITVDIYTPNYDAGTIRDKTLRMMYPDASQQAGSILQVRYSDDDYQTWSDFRKIDLSVKKPFLTDNSSFRRRAIHLRHQSPTFFRIKSLDMQLDIGTL